MPEVDYSHSSEGFIFTKMKDKVCDVPDDRILEDIENIDIEKVKQEEYQNKNEKRIIKTIKVDKNLLFYYPYEYYDCIVSSDGIGRIFTKKLKKLFRYRDELGLNRDTYLCVKVDKYFLIYQWENDSLVLKDEVHELLCSNYNGLKAYSVY